MHRHVSHDCFAWFYFCKICTRIIRNLKLLTAFKMTISKILIANRGEIACRVIRTANRMGIKCVAVYSDADRNSLHARLADEAVYIGKSPAQQSYLVKERIIDMAKKTNCQAVSFF